ncbi:ferredoxin [Burkholderia sp. WAC0059]|uniref:2Fe-2S iron-sulfur cluster-binding protein n=1 Tax=Burkholderia sp. WAC0059 TaxID=2066022 RepID=UPI000C7ED968|nr:2Fe-2S iron-sulfur cluster-binding protein [Burkholderia sp. WAC0059]PLZ02385.1 ferredoxin [Burkholderia sp. WAC0059]
MARTADYAGGATVRVTIDGETRDVAAGSTVAAALAAAGIASTRTSVGGTPRAPLCGMGVCQECRTTIDGLAHRLACQTLCADGQIIETTGPR